MEVALVEEEVKMPMVRIYIMGREYRVPAGLTIMKAVEYAGYRYIRGSGCRGGFCGACATIYRLKDDYKLRIALACQTTVEDGMYLTQIPFIPANKQIYDLAKLEPNVLTILKYYPEIARCVSCNTCSRACPQELLTMDYIQAALRGDLKKVAELSFDCIQCGLCAARCPAEIAHYHVAQLARRLYGKYYLKIPRHLEDRVREIEEKKYEEEMDRLMKMSVKELKELYVKRDVEA